MCIALTIIIFGISFRTDRSALGALELKKKNNFPVGTKCPLGSILSPEADTLKVCVDTSLPLIVLV